MRHLIDTHIWLWWYLEPERLDTQTRALMEDGGTELFFSTASVWEIAVKYRLGKLKLDTAPENLLPSELAKDTIQILPISMVHALRAGALPPHHQDPFDRMLIAQAQLENLTLVTADQHFSDYRVRMHTVKT
ncbi:MAG: twitching motility protein PilT [Lentisphaerae bacterium RIFOXYB12_FULL_65_16]|nr:MAG: twitching motility protein PilT [Lentisphaerae bacterium RIFOXYA12_64_32]OGV87249.1 MAG: twitching motility protein PilT [Lentisphaerae bacterium RIFOXYB12_FULL_65_16]